MKTEGSSTVSKKVRSTYVSNSELFRNPTHETLMKPKNVNSVTLNRKCDILDTLVFDSSTKIA